MRDIFITLEEVAKYCGENVLQAIRKFCLGCLSPN